MAHFTPQEQRAAAEIYKILDQHGIRAGLLAIRIILNRSYFVAEQAYDATSDLKARTDLKDYLRLLERSEKRVDGLIDFVDESGGLRPAEVPGKTSTSSLRSRPGEGFWAGVTSYFRGD